MTNRLVTDIAIVGGGIIGSSVAYFLKDLGYGGDVCVIERDETYALAATPHGAGGVRQLFSTPENIAMSRFSLAFYRQFSETMRVEDDAPTVAFRPQGYLFGVGDSGRCQLEANFHLQKTHGVAVEWLEGTALRDRFPSLASEGIVSAVYSHEDGWIDPQSALAGFRAKAIALGVRYLRGEVRGFSSDAHRIQSVVLDDQREMRASIIVNAAGAWATEIGAMMGMPLPIAPIPRYQHFFHSRETIEPLPLIKDETGLFVRPEGDGYVCGLPRWDIASGWNVTADPSYFERVVWPALVAVIPAFEALRLKRTWVGHYAQNTLDGNMILGPWVGGKRNVYVACGFSGHGIMHAPAVGRAVAELVIHGCLTSLDLSRLSYQRVIDGHPYPERGII